MPYKNKTISVNSYREASELYPNCSLPLNHPENWPDGPWHWVDPEPQAITKEQRRAQLKWERKERTAEPINNVQVATAEDRENVQWAAQNVESIDWIMADNTIQTLTAAELNAVITEYPLRKMALFGVYAGLIQQLETAEDPATVVWPE